MFVEDPRVPGKWLVTSFNEVKHMETLKKSPSSNPFRHAIFLFFVIFFFYLKLGDGSVLSFPSLMPRHIEGYYEDLSWAKYKSTGAVQEHVSGPPTK
jgi:hypothetical protein